MFVVLCRKKGLGLTVKDLLSTILMTTNRKCLKINKFETSRAGVAKVGPVVQINAQISQLEVLKTVTSY